MDEITLDTESDNKQVENRNSELQFNNESLVYAGFLPINGKQATRNEMIWFVVTLAQFVLMYFFVFVNHAMTEFSLVMSIRVIIDAINFLHALYRRLYFTYKIKAITSLVNAMDETPQSESTEFNSLESVKRLENGEQLQHFSSGVFVFYAGVSMTTLLLALFGSSVYSMEECKGGAVCSSFSRSLIFNVWIPQNFRSPSAYYPLLAWQFATVAMMYSNIAVTDAFTCAILRCVSQRSAFLSEAAARALLPGANNQFTSHFRAWVKYHQNYLRLVTKVNATLGPVLFVTIFLAALNIISLCYLSVQTSTVKQAAVCIAVLIVVLVQLYLFAYSGQFIVDKSEALARGTLGAAQVAKGALKDGPCRSALLVLVTRLSGGTKPEEVTGLGYFSASMEFFTKVLSASVSYLVVLLQFQPQSA